MNKDNEDNSKPNQLLYYTGQEGLFDEKLNPNIDNTEKISGGSALFRYFSSDIIVKQFNGFVCSPFCSKIDNNHLIITSRNIDILHDDLTRFQLEIIDEVIEEPIGGAHRDANLILQNVKVSISKNLNLFKNMSAEEIFNERKNKFLRIGRNKGFMNNLEDLSSLRPIENNLGQIWKSKKIFISIITLAIITLIATFAFL